MPRGILGFPRLTRLGPLVNTISTEDDIGYSDTLGLEIPLDATSWDDKLEERIEDSFKEIMESEIEGSYSIWRDAVGGRQGDAVTSGGNGGLLTWPRVEPSKAYFYMDKITDVPQSILDETKEYLGTPSNKEMHVYGLVHNINEQIYKETFGHIELWRGMHLVSVGPREEEIVNQIVLNLENEGEFNLALHYFSSYTSDRDVSRRFARKPAGIFFKELIKPPEVFVSPISTGNVTGISEFGIVHEDKTISLNKQNTFYTEELTLETVLEDIEGKGA